MAGTVAVRPTKAERKAAQRRTLDHAKKVLAPKIARYLSRKGGEIAHKAAARFRRITKDQADDIRQILDELGIDFSSLTETMQADLVDAFRHGGETAMRQVLDDPSGLFDALNPRAEAYVAERGAQLVTDIEETTRAGLRSILEDAFTEGLSPAELAERIRDSFEFSDARAEMIARTESAMAHVQGTLDGWKESGVVSGKSVILSNDHPDTDECDDAADLGGVAIDDDFGGLGDPPYHPNCECDVLPEVESGGGEE